jgi:hypothetical protein
VIEKIEHKGLNLHLVKVGEQTLYAIYQQINGELLVIGVGMGLLSSGLDLALDKLGLYHLYQLLQDLALELEATHVSVVCHHC